MTTAAQPDRIAFIGGGNMARAIIGGLLATGFPADQIAVVDPSPEAHDALGDLGITEVAGGAGAPVSQADLVVLAVKPQIMSSVTEGLGPLLGKDTTVMSIAAGIPVSALQDMLGPRAPAVVRCMPNTPSLIRCGACGLFAPKEVSAHKRGYAEAVMAAVGSTLWVEDEGLLDAVTALSGSGPAYFFAFIEAMINGGVDLGLSQDQASALALQTALGATRLAAEQGVPIDTLRRNVTSPGGTTERALAALNKRGLPETVNAAMVAAFDRAKEMSKEFS